MLVTPTTPFSQRAEPSPLWLRTSPKPGIRRGTTRISPRRLRKGEARLRLAGPPPTRRNGAPYGRGAGGESDPHVLAAGAARGRAKGDRGRDTLCLPFLGVALTTVIPGGKAVELMGKPVR